MAMTKGGKRALGAVLLLFALLLAWFSRQAPTLDPNPGLDLGADQDAALRAADVPEDQAGPTLGGGGTTPQAKAAPVDGPPPPDGTPGGPLWLRIVDPSGRPVPKAGIDWMFATGVSAPTPDLDVHRGTPDPMVRADEHGRAKVPSWVRTVAGGCFRVRQPGYLVERVPFPRGRQGDELVVRLERLVRMSGSVRDAMGRPWAGLRVTVTHAERAVKLQRTTSDDGTWSMTMLPGRVAIDVAAGAGSLASRSHALASEREFTWDLKVPAAGMICGTLHVPGAASEDRFAITCRWPDAPRKSRWNAGATVQRLVHLASGDPIRVLQPEGGRTAVFLVHRYGHALPLRVVKDVPPGETDWTLHVGADDRRTGTLRLTVERETPMDGTASLRGPEGVTYDIGFRHAGPKQQHPLRLTFEDVPVGHAYDLTIRPRATNMVVMDSEGRVIGGDGRLAPNGELPPLWSRPVRAVAGEVVDLGTIDLER